MATAARDTTTSATESMTNGIAINEQHKRKLSETQEDHLPPSKVVDIGQHKLADNDEGHVQDATEDAVADQENNVNRTVEIEEPVDEDDEDGEDDFGPMPASAATTQIHTKVLSVKTLIKRRKVAELEPLFLSQLPLANTYEKSYMHRDIINFTTVTRSGYMITSSVDGHLKFWKKGPTAIEFVKHFRAHLAPISAISASPDGLLLATVAKDNMLKIFDVINFDMINMIQLAATPKQVSWIYKPGQPKALVAVALEGSPDIVVYDSKETDVFYIGEDGKEIPQGSHSTSDQPSQKKALGKILDTVSLHSNPVAILQYNEVYHCSISIDIKGMIEYWSGDAPYDAPDCLKYKLKMDTDLYEFVKRKVTVYSLAFSPDGSMFVTMSSDRQIRVFKFLTGKLIRTYDESLVVIEQRQQAGKLDVTLDDMEFGRRMAVERDFDKTGRFPGNALFDKSGNFIIFPTPIGIKVVNIWTNKMARLIGQDDAGLRFIHISLYQDAPRKKTLTFTAAVSENPALVASEQLDPTLICTALKKNRFYLFTSRQADADEDRDVFNEKPSREEQTIAAPHVNKLQSQAMGLSGTIHTSWGDISFKLFPQYAPKAVENFVGLAKRGFYNNLTFHRVIKGFMIQTGCDIGDGTGGQSIWGREFEDEFVPELKHDRPYRLSLANPGTPNANLSQFFITVTATPWLDNKHTIFGSVSSGYDIVHKIEKCRVDRRDRPMEEITILSVDIESQ